MSKAGCPYHGAAKAPPTMAAGGQSESVALETRAAGGVLTRALAGVADDRTVVAHVAA